VIDTAISSASTPITLTSWSDRFALRTTGMKSSAIRELLKLTARPDVISFGGGLPAPEAFPRAEIAEAAARVLERDGREALQYGTTEGYLPLRELIVRHMGRYGIKVTPANVLITCGSQQALDLIGKLMIDAGDRILVEDPTYLGAIQAFGAYQPQYLTVPLDDDGLDVDHLEQQLRAGPKFAYVLPNFHNPAGVTLSLERRRRLVDLASHYGVPLLEDDPYGQLRYEGEHLPPLVVLDSELHGGNGGSRPFRGDVMYLGTMSKTLAPGLRIGWVVAPEEVIFKLVQLKQGADLHTGTFNQMVAWETARGGFLDRARRDAMLSALDRYFPPGCSWTRPQGGLFLWARLPEGMDSAKVLERALAEEKVAFVPGNAFHSRGGGANTMRLNFSYAPTDVAEEGIKRLGRAIDRCAKG